MIPKLANRMNTLRISRNFQFEAAHALQASDGHCKPIHGHTYQLRVTLIGEPDQQAHEPTRGMVMNFGDLSRIVESYIIKPREGALLLHQEAPAGLIESWRKIDKKLVLLSYQPTCENLLLDIRNTLQKHLPGNTQLYSLRLSDSSSQFAEWFASDNAFYAYASTAGEEIDNVLIKDSLHKANAAGW